MCWNILLYCLLFRCSHARTHHTHTLDWLCLWAWNLTQNIQHKYVQYNSCQHIKLLFVINIFLLNEQRPIHSLLYRAHVIRRNKKKSVYFLYRLLCMLNVDNFIYVRNKMRKEKDICKKQTKMLKFFCFCTSYFAFCFFIVILFYFCRFISIKVTTF